MSWHLCKEDTNDQKGIQWWLHKTGGDNWSLRKNQTSLRLLHHHTPIVSEAVERLCVPQMEEHDFLWRSRTCGQIIAAYHLIYKFENNSHGILPSSAPFNFCFFSSIVRSLSSCAFLYRYSRLSLTSRRSFISNHINNINQFISNNDWYNDSIQLAVHPEVGTVS